MSLKKQSTFVLVLGLIIPLGLFSSQNNLDGDYSFELDFKEEQMTPEKPERSSSTAPAGAAAAARVLQFGGARYSPLLNSRRGESRNTNLQQRSVSAASGINLQQRSTGAASVTNLQQRSASAASGSNNFNIINRRFVSTAPQLPVMPEAPIYHKPEPTHQAHVSNVIYDVCCINQDDTYEYKDPHLQGGFMVPQESREQRETREEEEDYALPFTKK